MMTAHDTKSALTAAVRARVSLSRDEHDEHAEQSNAMAGLPATLRFAMTLSHLEGFSEGDIANLVGLEPKAISALLKRGRELLAEEVLSLLPGQSD